MPHFAIEVENLGKKYIIKHQQHRSYRTLRDAIANSARSSLERVKGRVKPKLKSSEFWALQELDFKIEQGERLGIIGRNGAGKSTLLKLLSRITEPTTGKIILRGRIASLLEVGTGFHAELTGRENIYLNGAILGMSKLEIKRKFAEIVDFAGVEKFLDTPVKRYSSGMYVRLAFAVAAHLEPEILIVDEVLAVGDAQFQAKCLNKMRQVGQEGRTVIVVSHNAGVIGSLCNRGIYLDSGRLRYQGEIQNAIEHYFAAHQEQDSDYAPGVVYQKSEQEIRVNADSFQIVGIRLLDSKLQLKPIVRTWDYLRLRIHYYSPRKIRCGSVVLEIATLTGAKLAQYSTSPLSGLELPLAEGEAYIDCVIPNLPLAAGCYYLGAGLAIPMREWLCWQSDLATLEIVERDVYQSQFPPQQKRTPLALEHYWESP